MAETDVHPAWDRQHPLWMVFLYMESIGHHDAAMVHAPDAATAAQYGADALQADFEEAADKPDEAVEVDVVHVIPVIDRKAYAIRWAPQAELVPDEFQCCGGGGLLTGHSGHCPNKPETTEETDRAA